MSASDATPAAKPPAGTEPPGKVENAATAYIALGANLGDPIRMLADTVDQLSDWAESTTPGKAGFAVSGLYRSAPVDAGGPDYFNAVVRLQTTLSPHVVLDFLQSLETAGGRTRSTLNAPRTLDLDLLLHGNVTLNSERLILPHPRMHLRAFVLRPLLDVNAGDLLIAGHGTVAELEPLTRGQRIEKMPSPCAQWRWG